MELFYRKYGTGKPLVILHGLFGSGDNWMTQARMLGEHFAVYAVDLRNHGSSPHADKFSYAEMAEDVRLFLTEKVGEPAILIGHSMGGKVAMKVAGMYPDLITRLIVVDIVPKAYPLIISILWMHCVRWKQKNFQVARRQMKFLASQ